MSPSLHIVPDSDIQSPFQDDENVSLHGWHRRYGKSDYANPQALMDAVTRQGGKFVPVYLYDHGSHYYAPSFSGNPFGQGFHAHFDSGFYGFLVFDAELVQSAPQIYGSETELLRVAIGLLEAYTAYANGWGWGYVIEDENGVKLSSCYGFYSEGDARREGELSLNEEVAA